MSTASNVFAWDADSVEWTTLTMTVNYSVHTIRTQQEGIAGVDSCAWLKTQEQTGSGSAVFTFTRESPHFDDFIQSVNAWALVRGIRCNGFASKGYELTTAAQGDVNNNGDTIRTVYTQLIGINGPPFGDVDFDGSKPNAFTLNWSENFTFNGTGSSGSCSPGTHTNSSGSTTPTLGASMRINQANNQLQISLTGTPGPTLKFFSTGDYVNDSVFTTPITIDVATFKAAGSVDFGSTESWHFTDPGGLGFTTYAKSGSVSFVCS